MQELDLVTAAAWRSEEEGVGGGDKKNQKKPNTPSFYFTTWNGKAKNTPPLQLSHLKK